VQVTSGWTIDSETGRKREVLIFNGAGPRGKRVRIYKVVKKGKIKKVAGMLGAYSKWKNHGGI
jgi:hypothetical protein